MEDSRRNVVSEIYNKLPLVLLICGFSLGILYSLHFLVVKPQITTAALLYPVIFRVFFLIHVFLHAVFMTNFFLNIGKRFFRTVILSILGSIGFAAVSGIVFPWLGGLALGEEMTLYKPTLFGIWLILAAAFLGDYLASLKYKRKEPFFHSYLTSYIIDIFVSSMTALFYLASFGLKDWNLMPSGTFVVTVLCVIFSCMIPAALVNKK